MYKCEECGLIFERPKNVSAESYYGVSDLFDYSSGNQISVCPECEGTYTEYNEEEQEEENN